MFYLCSTYVLLILLMYYLFRVFQCLSVCVFNVIQCNYVLFMCYLWHLCAIDVPPMCYLCATYVLLMCYVCAIYVLCMCYLCATYVLPMCYPCVTYVLFMCHESAAHMLLIMCRATYVLLMYYLCSTYSQSLRAFRRAESRRSCKVRGMIDWLILWPSPAGPRCTFAVDAARDAVISRCQHETQPLSAWNALSGIAAVGSRKLAAKAERLQQGGVLAFCHPIRAERSSTTAIACLGLGQHRGLVCLCFALLQSHEKRI